MWEKYARITSASNQIIKEIRDLLDKKGRTKAGACILEGIKMVEEALNNKVTIRYLVVSDRYKVQFETVSDRIGQTDVYIIPDDLFKRIATTESPQGILALINLPVPDEELIQPFSKCVILENIQDPGNVGTIIRTADACGFDGVLLSKGCADPFNPKVLRSTMGSIFHIPVITCEDIFYEIEKLKSHHIPIVAAHPRNAATLWESPLKGRIAIVIGNEGKGLSERMLELTDIRVMIPMPGKAESFNAAAAASILLYESMRQDLSGDR